MLGSDVLLPVGAGQCLDGSPALCLRMQTRYLATWNADMAMRLERLKKGKRIS